MNPQTQQKQITVGIRKICCSQCVGQGIERFTLPRSLLEVNPGPPQVQQIPCRQCFGDKFIEVMVPIRPEPIPTTDGQTEQTKTTQKILQS